MYDEGQTRQRLEEQGFEVGQAVNVNGKLLITVNGILMFPIDADDLANGRATIMQIRDRNDGKILANLRR